ncbi:class I SAM-dependent methyltransferase [Ktedonosporobacter rubrisoli]|uniref:Class I SAM-dependent methyltransferase n=1 Tax=Ktedonosporobacter rubrisoli TaxID=2509675 RepID=A0A4P6JMR8_KTERU|nr:class I SAM-dependent methyltransferase [Ktedonosporobacter rubrisoli]QBD76322.1 class I SAM-dependent methyltransferase [Ktedonosporobacter rubrisoli]
MESQKARKEIAGTYIVKNKQNVAELQRLAMQDRMITASMGGIWPEQTEFTPRRRVMDIGCGPGGWAIEVAQRYQELSVIGIDINRNFIEYARKQAESQLLSERVEFFVMDALLILEFPVGYFDLVNLRAGSSFLRTWDWSKLLTEARRIARRGGVLRITDTEHIHESTSPALRRFQQMLVCALHQAGHLFTPSSDGLTARLPNLLQIHGYQQIQQRPYALEYRAGTPEGQAYYEDWSHMFSNFRPFLQKWGCLTPEYDMICEQARREMQAPDFQAIWNLLTVWGIAP